ncbi:MAG TPA: DNA repair protein RadC, partial [Aldersonia sp.]
MEALSDAELVAILLATAGRRGSTVGDLARQLIREFGSVERLATATIADLTRTEGIGPAKATTVCAAFELGRRAVRPPAETVLLTSSSAIAAAAAPLLTGRRERLLVLSADNRLRLHGVDTVSQGGADSASVPIREILSAVLRRDCSTFALAHQHPGGDPTPSSRDINATGHVAKAAGIAGLRLLDHVVIAGSEWRSVSSA